MAQVLGPGALGRPRGIGWRGRWEGGLRWGIHVYPWLIHVNVWQKPLQYCKVISLQLIKKYILKKKSKHGFPHSSVGKESTCNAGDPCLISELGRSPGEGKGYPLQCSGLENSMDCIVHGVTESRTGLSNFHFHGYQRGAVGAEKLVVWD